MNIDRLRSAKKAVKNLELVKRQLEHWEAEVSLLTDEFSLMDKHATFDGETTTVGELVDKITSAQDSVNYMTYENNDRMSRQEQREAQERLNDIIQLAEKAIQEAA
jgi:hypothetical protein